MHDYNYYICRIWFMVPPLVNQWAPLLGCQQYTVMMMEQKWSFQECQLSLVVHSTNIFWHIHVLFVDVFSSKSSEMLDRFVIVYNIIQRHMYIIIMLQYLFCLVHCRIVEHKSDARSDWKSVYKINDKVCSLVVIWFGQLC